MNKKTIAILCAVGALIVLILSIILIVSSCMPEAAPSGGGETTEDPGYGVDTWGDDVIADSSSEPDSDTTEQTDHKAAADDPSTDPSKGATVSAGVISPDTASGTTEPAEGTDSTDPSQGDTATTPTEGAVAGELTFEQYLALSGPEQEAYALSFPTMQDYISWYNAAKAEYDNKEVIEITGPIDLGEINP